MAKQPVKQVVDTPQELIIPDFLQALSTKKGFLPDIKSAVEEISIFKKREKTDPVLAVRIKGMWFSLFEWE